MSAASGLEAQQVVLEAVNWWERIKYTTRSDLDSVYDSSVRLKGFTAFNALKKVEKDQYPRDPFWATADWDRLEKAVIDEIDSRHGAGYYDQQMRVRNKQSPEGVF